MTPLTRNERLLLLAITALGTALRAEGLGELSLAHFDEGVLMSSAYDVRLKGLWQFTLAQPLQSPPLYPWLVSGLMWLTDFPSPEIGVYASALFGSATIPLFFLLARRWGGNRVGLAAAALLATSDLHIAFSRMALTEAALTFWFVLAMYAFARLMDACTLAAPVTSKSEKSSRATTGLRDRAGGSWRWAIAAGLATAAAWNTKYNGWMPLAIIVSAWIIRSAGQKLAGFGRASRNGGAGDLGQKYDGRRFLVAMLIAGAIAAICYVPWYRYVERTLPGGYAAVTENHLNYVGGLTQWPERAARLFGSLSAFRHSGWALTIIALVAALAWQTTNDLMRRRAPSDRRVMMISFILAALGLAVAAIIGADATCLLVAIAAIVPALVWGRFEQIVLAVWVGSFVVLTPFYHPYTRLLVPALPGAIALALWILSAVYSPRHSTQRAAPAEIPATACFAIAVIVGLAAAVAAHPFGWLPSEALWQRWTTRRSYRAFNDEVREHTPQDAHFLCQGMPIMPLYIERRWDSLGHVPFTAWIGHVPNDCSCYLAVDFWGIFGEHHEAAREALAENLGCLQPVAWVDDDLNVVTLLDYLPPAAVARRLSQVWPAQTWPDRQGRSVVVPAEPRSDHVTAIVLYRVDRECLASD